ncbi:MAG: DUF4160 domain-containing protein [Deltaproteobacteria bacterium]|nr:DUF4160 domain-containing protein [Deltaproteobacteria bacterium]MBI3296005.1 DUF4160 domain-containing protein [Deltaproteobacteria bacterium]
MSPTVFRHKNYKFFFFSREETRMHIHVLCPDGEAKFWMEPRISLASHQKLRPKQLKEIESIIQERSDEIRTAWKRHFRS